MRRHSALQELTGTIHGWIDHPRSFADIMSCPSASHTEVQGTPDRLYDSNVNPSVAILDTQSMVI